MQQVRLSSFTYLINRLKSVGYCIGTSGLFVFKKCCSFKKAVGLIVNRYGIIVPLYGMMMSPHRGEASPCGTMTSPYGMMTVPYGMMTSPHGMMSVPHGMITSPYGLMSVPYGMMTRPHGMMMIPYGTMMIPSDISGVHRDGLCEEILFSIDLLSSYLPVCLYFSIHRKSCITSKTEINKKNPAGYNNLPDLLKYS